MNYEALPEAELYTEFFREMEGHQEDVVILPPLLHPAAFALAALIQLALKHPMIDTKGVTVEIGKEVFDKLTKQMNSPAIAETLRRGWNKSRL